MVSIEQALQNFILSKYKSINQFATDAEIPYTTVKGGFDRGIMGMSVQNVIKMCRTLNIDINKLAEGKIEPIKRSTMLDVDEFNLISQYRVVDKYGKKIITDVATHEYERCAEMQQQIPKIPTVSAKVARSVGDKSKPEIVEVDKSKYLNAPESDIDM